MLGEVAQEASSPMVPPSSALQSDRGTCSNHPHMHGIGLAGLWGPSVNSMLGGRQNRI